MVQGGGFGAGRGSGLTPVFRSKVSTVSGFQVFEYSDYFLPKTRYPLKPSVPRLLVM